MRITNHFDSGNIEIVQAENRDNIQLNIKKDHNSKFYQWFHFRVSTTAHSSHQYHILNAAESAYPEGWQRYQVLASYDRHHWFRIPTQYEQGVLHFSHTPERPVIFYAYFIPYSFERHLDLIHDCQLAPNCQLQDLGLTPDGRPLSLLVIGDEQPQKSKIWLTARQHPGETMAEWYIEGVLDRLLSDDNIAQHLRQQATFYIVPNMNPDGSYRGHLRTNAHGVNLNREWLNPSIEHSPEVFWVREKMLEIGVDLYLDIHGDEMIPYNFVATNEGIPSYNDNIAELETLFKTAYLHASGEFQVEHGYPQDPPGEANLTVASAWVGETFETLALTLEMPFIDNFNLPNKEQGWSDTRSQQFGADLLPVLLQVIQSPTFKKN